jgi:hypothetical protein
MSNPEENPKIIIDEDWKSQVQAEKAALEKDKPAEVDSGSPDSGGPAQESGPMPPLPAASFAQLVTIFATQASVSMQQAVDPSDKQGPEHLTYAKHFIDLLAVIEQKTQGNLSSEEAQMLESILHELRMAFVSLQKR